MSVNEAFQLIKGGTVYNDKDHKKAGNLTNSVGSCFAILPPKHTDIEIFEFATFLSGITTMDIAFVGTIKTPSRKGFVRSWGGYKAGKLKEMSTVEYKLEDFENWHMYAPNDRYTFLPTISANWYNPVEISQRQDW